MSVSDKTLVRRLLAGEEDAFALFFGTNFARLYRFALTRTDGDADAAEEVAQKTLIVALRKLHTFRGEATCSHGSARFAVMKSRPGGWRKAATRR